MNLITLIGLTAAVLTTISFLPQVIKSWKFKKTEGISLVMYILFCSGILTWLIYGLLIKDLPLIIANFITLILSSSILFLKIKYK